MLTAEDLQSLIQQAAGGGGGGDMKAQLDGLTEMVGQLMTALGLGVPQSPGAPMSTEVGSPAGAGMPPPMPGGMPPEGGESPTDPTAMGGAPMGGADMMASGMPEPTMPMEGSMPQAQFDMAPKQASDNKLRRTLQQLNTYR